MKTLIVANWKMNPVTIKQANKIFLQINQGTKNIKKTKIVFCVPSMYLRELLSSSKNKNYIFGGQNCFWEKQGAFTGKTSCLMLKNSGCKYVILGHSERREYFSETDSMINKKLKSALNLNLRPILCIGETKQQRKENLTQEVLFSQIKNALAKINKESISKRLSIAYEPIWAIGKYACEADKAEQVLLFLKESLGKILGIEISRKIPILYGGSVNSKNAKSYINAGFQGLLIGHNSIVASEFIKIVNSIETS